jgi:hypothetical protein
MADMDWPDPAISAQMAGRGDAPPQRSRDRRSMTIPKLSIRRRRRRKPARPLVAVHRPPVSPRSWRYPPPLT